MGHLRAVGLPPFFRVWRIPLKTHERESIFRQSTDRPFLGQFLEAVDGQEDVEVFVMGVEPEQQRVALSLKRLKPDPWTLVDERYEIGQIIEAEITNVVSFGAFARVAEGLEGLIHVSELAEGNFLHPRNVVNEGERVKACILNIDSANHRLGLSLRQVSNHNDGHPYQA